MVEFVWVEILYIRAKTNLSKVTHKQYDGYMELGIAY